MDLDELQRIIDESSHSAFRLETLSQYLVPQEESLFAAWRAGTPLPPRTPESDPWLARIQADTSRGYRWYRVHILDHPLTDYLRYELCSYQFSQAAGAEVYLADRRAHPDLEDLRGDFWLIDNEIAIRMIYDEEGRFVRPERATDVETYRSSRDTALRHSESMDDYLSRTQVRLTV